MNFGCSMFHSCFFANEIFANQHNFHTEHTEWRHTRIRYSKTVPILLYPHPPLDSTIYQQSLDWIIVFQFGLNPVYAGAFETVSSCVYRLCASAIVAIVPFLICSSMKNLKKMTIVLFLSDWSLNTVLKTPRYVVEQKQNADVRITAFCIA